MFESPYAKLCREYKAKLDELRKLSEATDTAFYAERKRMEFRCLQEFGEHVWGEYRPLMADYICPDSLRCIRCGASTLKDDLLERYKHNKSEQYYARYFADIKAAIDGLTAQQLDAIFGHGKTTKQQPAT